MFGSKDRRREQYIDSYRFGAALEDRVRSEHHEISGADCISVFEGLRHWFQVCRVANHHFVAMPSIAVDAAWHEFILCTRDYAAFCAGAFGRFLHHTPAGALSTPDPVNTMRKGYALTWHHACVIDGVDPYTPDRLPLLFAIDDRVGMPGGFRYDVAEIAAERSAARRQSNQDGLPHSRRRSSVERGGQEPRRGRPRPPAPPRRAAQAGRSWSTVTGFAHPQQGRRRRRS